MNPELGQLQANFATALHELVEQRNNEPELDRLESELSDPDASFIGALRVAASVANWYKSNDSNTYTTRVDCSIKDFEGMIVADSVDGAYASKWSDELFDEEGHLVDRGEESWWFYHYAALTMARKLLKEEDPQLQARGLLVTARIAAFNLPDGYDGQKPKRHKQESVENGLFRKAVTILHEKVNAPANSVRVMHSLFEQLDSFPDEDSQNKYFVAAMTHPDNELLRKSKNDISMSNFAIEILSLLAREQTTPESFREEQFKLARMRELQKEQPEPEPVTVNWEILPPEALEEIERTGKTGSKEGNPDFVDPERLRWLARLAIDWGNDAYIVVSSLRDKSDSSKYYAAILPGLSDGIPVEHAVAENASSGNATYVFRGDRGVNPDGSVWLNWRDVLRDTKTGARALGAKRILHGQFWDENVIEYLTRPGADLDSKYYKR